MDPSAASHFESVGAHHSGSYLELGGNLTVYNRPSTALYLVSAEGATLGCAKWTVYIPDLNVAAPPNSSWMSMAQRLAAAGVVVDPNDPGLWTVGGDRGLEGLCRNDNLAKSGSFAIFMVGTVVLLLFVPALIEVKENLNSEGWASVSFFTWRIFGTRPTADGFVKAWQGMCFFVAATWGTLVTPKTPTARFGIGGAVPFAVKVVVCVDVAFGISFARGAGTFWKEVEKRSPWWSSVIHAVQPSATDIDDMEMSELAAFGCRFRYGRALSRRLVYHSCKLLPKFLLAVYVAAALAFYESKSISLDNGIKSVLIAARCTRRSHCTSQA